MSQEEQEVKKFKIKFFLVLLAILSYILMFVFLDERTAGNIVFTLLKYAFLIWLIVSVFFVWYWIWHVDGYKEGFYSGINGYFYFGTWIFFLLCFWKGVALIIVMFFGKSYYEDINILSFIVGLILNIIFGFNVSWKINEFKLLKLKKEVFIKLYPKLYSLSTELIDGEIEIYKKKQMEINNSINKHYGDKYY